MLEAMAAGTPVAAYPVDGPLEVLGKADGSCHGGVMNEDLQQACYAALAVPRHEARQRALDFSWSHAAELFESFLVIAGKNSAQSNPDTIKGSTCQPFQAGAPSVKSTVTPLS
jgi:glycosyltransferase involved in cell wall biosynthesis